LELALRLKTSRARNQDRKKERRIKALTVKSISFILTFGSCFLVLSAFLKVIDFFYLKIAIIDFRNTNACDPV